MEKQCIGNMKLVEIVKTLRTFQTSKFCKSYLYDNQEIDNKGTIDAYNEIINDLYKLNYKDFINKYLKKIKEFNLYFEKNNGANIEKMEYFSQYNNAIVNVLKIIDPGYEYMEYINLKNNL